MKKKKVLFLVLILIIAAMPVICYAGSWYTGTINATATRNYNSESFYNEGQPLLNLYFNPSSFYRTYTIYLQRQNPDGSWNSVEQKSGGLVANKTVGVTFQSSSLRIGTFRYNIQVDTSSTFNGSFQYYK